MRNETPSDLRNGLLADIENARLHAVAMNEKHVEASKGFDNLGDQLLLHYAVRRAALLLQEAVDIYLVATGEAIPGAWTKLPSTGSEPNPSKPDGRIIDIHDDGTWS